MATFIILCALAAGAYFVFNKPQSEFQDLGTYVVIVSHDHKKQTFPSKVQTVGLLLSKLHIHMRQDDVVEPSLTTLITEDNFRINVYRAKPVEIIDGNQKQFTFSASSTPRSIAEQAGFTVYAADKISEHQVTNFAASNSLSNQIIIQRATPVKLNLYGTPVNLRTQAKTVAGLLQKEHIKLSLGDHVKPGLDTLITPNMQIFISHEGVKIESAKKLIPMPTTNVKDSKLTVGTSAIRQHGSPGSEILTYQDTLKNGKLVGRTLIQKVVTRQPITQIVAIGTAPLGGGSLQVWLYKLRACESSGNYQDNTGNGYYGAYQFSLGTWRRLGYSGLPSNAPPYIQDQAIIKNTNGSSGLISQNPGCYESTGISNYPPS